MATFSIEPNERITYRSRFEDEHLLVVEKPAGVATQPGRGHLSDTLLNGVFAHHGLRLQNLGRSRDFGLLHRLDRQTSGLVVIALTARAYDALRDQFASRAVRKFYWAVVKGAPRGGQGVIRKPILEVGGDQSDTPDHSGPRRPKTAKISAAGKPAVTAYRTLQSNAGASLLECRPVTGRLYQVRLHLAAIHCPILGDDVYARGAARAAAPRLALHAHRLVFDHPMTAAKIDLRTGWPTDLRGLLRRLGMTSPATKSPAAPSGEAKSGSGPASAPIEGGHELDDEAIGDEESGVGE